MKFTQFDKATGRIINSGTTDNLDGMVSGTTDVLSGEEHYDGYVMNGAHFEYPPQPSPHHAFNYTTKQWEDLRTLDDLKAAQWTAIKKARSAAEYAGFTWDGSTFDSDVLSQNRITGAVSLAQMSSAFTIGWILADNTVRTLNQISMLQVGATLGQHVAEVFAKGVLLREAVEAATTQAEVEAVVW